MKKFIIINILIAVLYCCSDENDIKVNDDFIMFTVNNQVFEKEGHISYISSDVDGCVDNRFGRTSPVEITNHNYGERESNRFYMYLWLPGCLNDFSDTLVGRKFPIVGNSSQYSNIPLALDINLYVNDISYRVVEDRQDSRFYNQLTSIKYIGPYYNSENRVVYEIEGKFNVCFLELNSTSNDSIFVNDGSYKVQVVLHNDIDTI